MEESDTIQFYYGGRRWTGPVGPFVPLSYVNDDGESPPLSAPDVLPRLAGRFGNDAEEAMAPRTALLLFSLTRGLGALRSKIQGGASF